MARNRSVDFLPEIFKTETNKEFLASTLDQLVQKPKLKQSQGFIGRDTRATGDDDTYIKEPTLERTNYQLEPAVIFKKEDNSVDELITYPEILDALKTEGADITKHSRLFSNEIYSWSPLIDFDKFVNHSQYYWLPQGPDSVDVSATDINLTDDFEVTRNNQSYDISGIGGENPTIYLARGGEYTFSLNQTGHSFWIQTEPGLDGEANHSPNISTREVLGVTNNGGDLGEVTFSVPLATSQSFYDGLTSINDVSLATNARFDSINGALLSNLKSIDGITDLEGMTIVFLNSTAGDSADLGWQYLDLFESDDTFESDPLDEPVYIDSKADRYSVYQIEYLSSDGNTILKLNRISSVDIHSKFKILYGKEYSNKSFYKNSGGYFEEIPLLTASKNTLYYQDGTDANKFGKIKLIDNTDSGEIDISEIEGQKNYVSPNGIKFSNGLKVIFRGNVSPISYQNQEYYVEGVGTSIKLIKVSDLSTPESYVESETETYDSTSFSSSGFDGNLNAPKTLDFITINRASIDGNPWSRSNRWVHKEVIEKTAEYNKTTPLFDNNNRANRPIIEFDANLKLFNFGILSKTPVTVIDFSTTDALSDINGQTGFSIDGTPLVNGSRVIFANDTDTDVKNKIYKVEFVDANNDGTKEINLVEADDSTVETNNCVLVTNGTSRQGKMYHYDGTNWVESQQKTATNQAPLFDIFDKNNNSYSDTDYYSGSTFAGSKIFSYKQGSGSNDQILGFPLSYLNIDNIGDIVFDNNLYSDTFTYGSSTKKVSDGYVKKYSDLTTSTNEIGWTTYVDEYIQPQIFDFFYDGTSLDVDVTPKSGLTAPAIKVYKDNKFVSEDKYTYEEFENKTVIKFTDKVEEGTVCQVRIISDDKSDIAYYEIPKNLENNPFNDNDSTLTLGTIRSHYTTLAQNIAQLEGTINGSNNIRDLGQIAKYGTKIIQSGSTLLPLAKFLHSSQFNFFKSLEFGSKSYDSVKAKIIDYVGKVDVFGKQAYEVLDDALKNINLGKNSANGFYKSDMLPGLATPTTTTYTITSISTGTLNTNEIYDFTKANNKAILVYRNNEQLIKDTDYSVSTDSATITLSTYTTGDEIVIKEYSTTVGSYVPNTPTKMGLHPRYAPRKYIDDSYLTSTEVIQGHDGSITVAYGDFRDDVLLEFEKRIYNNIKVNDSIPIVEADVIPGKFRTTDYSAQEVIDILSVSFLNWLGNNNVDYKTQDYRSTNEFTWNYSTAASILDGTSLKGHWRGIYKNYFDTDTPHKTPWEMLGLTTKPSWWEDEYGEAPYTRGNEVLWDDLEAGIVKDPAGSYVVEKYKRPNLKKVIPVDSKGNLISPFECMVTNYSEQDFKRSWVIGDVGPSENAWRRSSSYRFALQRLFALTKPAKYFALNIDRDLYKYDDAIKQYLWDGRYRLNVKDVVTQKATQPKNSYTNWIADYHNNNGCPCIEISNELKQIDVRLTYRMAGFTDKNYLKIFTEKSSPDSENSELLLPDQSYTLLLHKNQPLTQINYSAVVVQKADDGYTVFGHSKLEQYFKIYRSISNRQGFKVDDFLIPTDFVETVTTVPYGYTFRTKAGVVDFLASYGAYLTKNGLLFNSTENNVELNWTRMIEEFLMWAGQDWGTGTIVNLNPSAISLEFNRELLIVDNITANSIDALDQNGISLTTKDFYITRLDNSFKITTINGKTINYLRIRSTSYEHALVLDNSSVFNDLVYEPLTGLRQQRLKMIGFTTYDWNGQLDAQGFILNQDNVAEWEANKYYYKGALVKFKNQYWSSVGELLPTQEFSFDDWSLIDYKTISKGLLPNLSSKTEQIQEYYNKKTSNLENDIDLLAMGLVGFRPRKYLSNLDDVTQVNFYTEFVKNKGTLSSSYALNNVDFEGKTTKYEIFENWAVKESTFGNSDNKNYIEYELDKTHLNNNPSIVKVVPNSNTDVNPYQQIKIEDIYDESKTISSTSIYPLRDSNITDTNLPTAGFVYSDDVDIAVYELSDLIGSGGIAFANTIKEGSLIWVANDNNFSWNVYRASREDFTVGDFGLLYRTSSADWVLTTADSEWLSSDNLAIFWKLTSVRVGTESELVSNTYINDLPNGSKVWVDENSNDKTALFTMDSGTYTQTREESFPVDVELITKVLAYDKDTQITNVHFDYIDPINGKILGVAKENIDYISGYDPASYSQGTNTTGLVWGKEHVGNIWWNTSGIRFLHYYNSNVITSSNDWASIFPNSPVEVYQWVESKNPPSSYTGEGTVVDSTQYSTVSRLNNADTITQTYYFWVKGITSIHTTKKLSTKLIADYIKNPKSSGIPFCAFINENTIGLYNSEKYLENAVLHIGYKSQQKENEVFNEYGLIKENYKNDFLNDQLYLKLIDSLVGENKTGLTVPDPNLNNNQKYGISFRPRQSLFENRTEALKDYLTNTNKVLAQYIISTNKTFTQLNKADPLPKESTGLWDTKVANYDELQYQNLLTIDVGHKYLVESDENYNGLWTIYEVISGPSLSFVQKQTYDTTNLWNYIDWYKDDDARNSIPLITVDTVAELNSLTVENNTYVKVSSNIIGKFEVWQIVDETWHLVGVEDGTIEFLSTIWTDSSTNTTELRNVIKAINEDLFVDELLIEKNKLLIKTFNYILTEQKNVEWLYKTSLIDVHHTVRNLETLTTYKKDDQDFLKNYIEESKPYHTKIKDYLLKYNGDDQYNADLSDFDNPTYYDSTFLKNINPILDYDGIIIKSDQSNFDEDGVGLKETDYNIWELDPWSKWYNNHKLSIKSVNIENPGSGFDEAPKITVTGGGATKQASLSARINIHGEITEITVEDSGEGYMTTPTITVGSGNSTAKLSPVMQNELVRSIIPTLKYDRINYSTTVVDWEANSSPRPTVDSSTITIDTTDIRVDKQDTVYESGQLVRYNNKVYTQDVTRAWKSKFLLEDFTEVDSSTLSAADRTMGYYTPGKNQQGLNLAMLINGIDYPGVLVKDLDFSSSGGFSILAYDTDLYDGGSVSDDGSEDVSNIIDSTIESSFNDMYLGTKPEDIIVGGGEFVDTYSSHAPEELIPGSIFDTLSLVVNTRPSFDYRGNGHGFEVAVKSYEYSSSTSEYSFKNVVAHPVTIQVLNGTTRTTLREGSQYTVDFVNKTVSILGGIFDEDTLVLMVNEIGGGNQLLRDNFNGGEFKNELTIPVKSSEIYDIVIFVNGSLLKDGFTSSGVGQITVDGTLTTADSTAVTVDANVTSDSIETKITFNENYTESDFISVSVFGFEDTQYEWSGVNVTKFQKQAVDTTSITVDSSIITADFDSSRLGLGDEVSLSGKNKENAIVEINGKRLRPPEGVRYEGDGSETDFRLPTVGDVDHTLVSSSEIVVFLGEERQTNPTDYTVITVVDGSDTYKEVRFSTAPADGVKVEVYTTYPAEYNIDGNGDLVIKSSVSVSGTDDIVVTTWNDTNQLDILTSTFVGPTTTTTAIVELFDSGGFDTVSFDFVGSSSSDVNVFDLGRPVSNGNRLWVTLNGNFLTPDVDYSVSGSNILLAGDIISPTDEVSITSFTSNLVPDELAFRIFKDMQGNKAIYKINTCCLKDISLTKNLELTDTHIYVDDVAGLPTPNLALGKFGIIMINGERITYREKDSNTNTLTGLRRGTAGTGAAIHLVGDKVQDITTNTLVENSIIESNTLGSDTKTSSSAEDKIFYANGTSTASNGIALQNQTTVQANFLKAR